MALEPDDRYQTCEMLATDLQKWMAGETPSVWKEYWAVIAWQWAKRHRSRVVPAAAALLIALSLITAYVTIESRRQQRLRISGRALLDNANQISAEPDARYTPSRLAEAREAASKAQTLLIESNDKNLKRQVDNRLQELTSQLETATRNNALIRDAESKLANASLKNQTALDTLTEQVYSALDEWPDHPGLNMLHVALLRQSARNYQTLAACLKAAKTKVDADQRLILAKTLTNVGAIKDAIEILREVPPDSPDFGRIVTWSAAMLCMQGLWEEGKAEIQLAIKKDASHPVLHDTLARFYGNEGQADQCIAELEYAARVDPNNPACLVNLAAASRFWGKIEKAVVVLEALGDMTKNNNAMAYEQCQRELTCCREVVNATYRMPEFLQGAYVPKDEDARFAMAEACYNSGHFGKSAQIYSGYLKRETDRVHNFQQAPVDKLVNYSNGNLFHLFFRSTALAGLGQSADAATLKPEFREQSLQYALEQFENMLDSTFQDVETGEARSQILLYRPFLAAPHFVQIRKLTLDKTKGEEHQKWANRLGGRR